MAEHGGDKLATLEVARLHKQLLGVLPDGPSVPDTLDQLRLQLAALRGGRLEGVLARTTVSRTVGKLRRCEAAGEAVRQQAKLLIDQWKAAVREGRGPAAKKQPASRHLKAAGGKGGADAAAATRYAITFGEVAILHTGGAEVGEGGMRESGYSVGELRALQKKIGEAAELVMVSDALPAELRAANEAAVLVVRGGS